MKKLIIIQWIIIAALALAIIILIAAAAPEEVEPAKAALPGERFTPYTRITYTEPEPEPVEEEVIEMVSLGEFKLYAYCPCVKCCGKWADGITAAGTTATQGRTVAVDPDVIPLGSMIYIDGLGEFVCEDTGAGIGGKTIDIFMDSHEGAVQFGIQYAEVRLIEEGDAE